MVKLTFGVAGRQVMVARIGVTALSGLLAIGCGSSSNKAASGAAPSGGTATPAAATPAASGSSSGKVSWPASAEATASAQGTQAAAKAGAAAKLPSDVSIGFLLSGNEAADRAVEGAAAAAQVLGWKVNKCTSTLQLPTQVACVQKLINQGTKVMFTTALPGASITRQLQEEKSKGIIHFNIAGAVPDEESFAASYAPDDDAFVGAADAALFGEMKKRGVTKLAVLYNTALPTLAARYQKFQSDLQQHPELQVVAKGATSLDDPNGSVTTNVRTALTAHSDIGAYWTSINFEPGLVANVAKSIRGAGKLPVVVALYGDQPNLAAVRSGLVTAVVDVPMEQGGWAAIDQAAEALARQLPVQRKPAYPFPLQAPNVLTKATLPPPGQYAAPPFDYEAFFTAKWKKEFGL
jgi:ABC-type sugar transport system substrate-binding protein